MTKNKQDLDLSNRVVAIQSADPCFASAIKFGPFCYGLVSSNHNIHIFFNQNSNIFSKSYHFDFSSGKLNQLTNTRNANDWEIKSIISSVANLSVRNSFRAEFLPLLEQALEDNNFKISGNIVLFDE